MAQPAEISALFLKSYDMLVRQTASQKFDRHGPVENKVSVLVYFAHATFADQFDNFISTVQHVAGRADGTDRILR
jgi:hypothetical protein